MPCSAVSAADNAFMNTKSKKKWRKPVIKVPRGAILAICILPAVLILLFYALRPFSSVMDWATMNISAPVRRFLGMLSSIYPISIMEILFAATIIWLVFYLVKTIMVTVRRRGKWMILGKRLLPVVVAALYVWGAFCWLWVSGYHASSFAEKNGFSGGGVLTQDLIAVTELFAAHANELALLVERDEDGHFVEDRHEMFAASTYIFQNIATEFPSLGGRLYRPKPMIFSWLMSRTGYTGIYFALTGEANINTLAPGFLMPATVAHEHAHHLGVFAEDEANFVGILACIKSGNTIFEYAGYLKGLMYLLSAVFEADYMAWLEISASLSDQVLRDWQDNSDYWQSQRVVETGVEFLDGFLTAVTVTVSDAVDTIYDGFLKSQNQELGIRSYGACVDLLVEYFVTRGLVAYVA